MREPPGDLAEESLELPLRFEYGLDLIRLEFLPVGHDAYAWAYRVQTTREATYFLKVRRGHVNEPGLFIPHYLQSIGIDAVIAPLPARSGRLWAGMGPFSLVLYPFMAGESGAHVGMTPEQWIEYGTILRQIHSISLPSNLAGEMRRETFVPEGAALVRQVSAHLAEWNGSDPVERSRPGSGVSAASRFTCWRTGRTIWAAGWPRLHHRFSSATPTSTPPTC
jgi:spectinomycin phosphotransferase